MLLTKMLATLRIRVFVEKSIVFDLTGTFGDSIFHQLLVIPTTVEYELSAIVGECCKLQDIYLNLREEKAH